MTARFGPASLKRREAYAARLHAQREGRMMQFAGLLAEGLNPTDAGRVLRISQQSASKMWRDICMRLDTPNLVRLDEQPAPCGECGRTHSYAEMTEGQWRTACTRGRNGE